ncbi:MAG: hypothetical protein QXM68_02635 [Candidatus Aenigmatarchaeota archaeon]|nr:hypothetical protein [Candidatus Aenigmarchaeota archaeon]
MKGVTALLEATLAGIILIMLFMYFFPQFSIKTEWTSNLLQQTTNDVLLIIDNTNQVYNFARNNQNFDSFMRRLFPNSVYIWWKSVDNLPGAQNTEKLYFTKAKKATIVDVVNYNGAFRVYSFTLYLGYVF